MKRITIKTQWLNSRIVPLIAFGGTYVCDLDGGASGIGLAVERCDDATDIAANANCEIRIVDSAGRLVFSAPLWAVHGTVCNFGVPALLQRGESLTVMLGDKFLGAPPRIGLLVSESHPAGEFSYPAEESTP